MVTLSRAGANPSFARGWRFTVCGVFIQGFVEFHLLKGPEAEDHRLYASHTVWKNRATFEAWTKSEAFRAAHSRAGDNKPLYLDHPQFEGFEVRQTVGGRQVGVTLAPRGASVGNASPMSVIGGEPDLARTYQYVAD
jgi:heme-degrading monooxygenase HmoA